MIKKNKTMNEIEAIRHHYGESEFRMAIQHLIDTGQQNFTEENVAATKAEICKKTPKNAILTESFQCRLLDCCLELSRHRTWDILLYIKLYLYIKDDDLVLLKEADEALAAYNVFMAPEAWKEAVADPGYREDILREMIRQHNVEYAAAEIKAAISNVVAKSWE